MVQPSAENSSAASPPAQPGMSGRKLTMGLLLALAMVAAGLSYVLWSYNRVDSQRASVNASWNQLVEELAQRYRPLELQIARGVDERQIEMELGERFRLAMERFRSTAQPHLQWAAAADLESLLQAAGVSTSLSPSAASAAEAYNAEVRELHRLLESPGGRILVQFLNFSDVNLFPPSADETES